jgi:hypothetical protein
MKEIVSATAPGKREIGSKEIVTPDSGIEALVPRDQWDRPLILPASGHKTPCVPHTGKGGGCKCMIGYTRVSTMAETLSDSFGLNRWQKGNLVRGLVRRPDLLNEARLVTDPAHKSKLYAVCDQAENAGDNDVASRNGTFMHRLTARIDNGEDLPDHLPENIQAMLDAYVAEMARHHFEASDTETFVVQDKVKVAGSFDKRASQYVADVKTGQNLDYMALKTTMQVAMYAASDAYDIGTHERLPLGVDRDRGVLIWLPWVEDPKDAECECRWLDLRLGRKAVLEAVRVRDLRKLNAAQLLPRVK